MIHVLNVLRGYVQTGTTEFVSKITLLPLVSFVQAAHIVMKPELNVSRVAWDRSLDLGHYDAVSVLLDGTPHQAILDASCALLRPTPIFRSTMHASLVDRVASPGKAALFVITADSVCMLITAPIFAYHVLPVRTTLCRGKMGANSATDRVSIQQHAQ